MFEVQSSFIKKRMTTKSSDRWSAFVREKTVHQAFSCPLGHVINPLALLTSLSFRSRRDHEHDILLQAVMPWYMTEVFQFTPDFTWPIKALSCPTLCRTSSFVTCSLRSCRCSPLYAFTVAMLLREMLWLCHHDNAPAADRPAAQTSHSHCEIWDSIRHWLGSCTQLNTLHYVLWVSYMQRTWTFA